MLYCPYCGGLIKEDEIFCSQCGQKIPSDIDQRISKQYKNQKMWYIPIFTFIFMLLSIGGFYLFLEKKEALAREYFKTGETLAIEGKYQEAYNTFEKAIDKKPNFPSAHESISFMELALEIEQDFHVIKQGLENKKFQQSLQLISKTETNLEQYSGAVVSDLLNRMTNLRNTILIKQLEENLSHSPSLEELKTLLWEAEAINTKEADTIATTIRNQIVAHVYTAANKELANKNFTTAREIVEDGIEYVPHSEKLNSFQTTIEKEKTAFEIAQQKRIEQAITAAQQERKKNKHDAVHLLDVKVLEDEQKNLVVSGKLKSEATVPINSISVEYVLLDNHENVVFENEVYVYPETLYPKEEGKFDYTHFNLTGNGDNFKVKIKKIKWYLD